MKKRFACKHKITWQASPKPPLVMPVQAAKMPVADGPRFVVGLLHYLTILQIERAGIRFEVPAQH